MAVAEQLGRIIGTVQAKVDGIERKAPESAGKGADEEPTRRAGGSAAAAGSAASRANVDAPGKRHRKPVPSDPGVKHSDERIAKLKSANESRHGRHRRG